MKDFIIISGAPGSGKSTIAKLLQEKLKSPYIDFGWMREWHLLPDWSDQSIEEESIAWNQAVKNRSDLLNEYKLNNTHNNPVKTADLILELLRR